MMMPFCTAAPSCSSLSPISYHAGTRAVHALRKIIDDKCVEHGNSPVTMKAQASASYSSMVSEGLDSSCSLDSSIFSPYTNEYDDIVCGFPKEYFEGQEDSSFFRSEICEMHPVANNILPPSSSSQHELLHSTLKDNFSLDLYSEPVSSVVDQTTVPSNIGSDLAILEVVASTSPVYSTAIDDASDDSIASSITFDGANKGIEDSLSRFVDSLAKSVFRAEDALTESYDALRLSFFDAIGKLKKSIGGSIDEVLSSVVATKERATGELGGVTNAFQVKTSLDGALPALRRAIVTVEDSVVTAAGFAVYSYEAAKSSLPPNVKASLSSSEEKVTQVLRPIGDALQQVYIVIERFETNLGLDANDPVVQLILFFGASAAVGVTYWTFIYGGYAGDLEPELAMELLKTDKNALLIDVRPEDVRGRDGIPDLRRTARSKYITVLSPEIDESIKKVIKGGRELDDALVAVVIRNLKVLKNDSKVIIMDANGNRGKGIARSLRRLGLKRPYLLKGGFQSWAKSDLRIKELKPETALTVLNEEAEAILEVIKPTPTLIAGYSLCLAAIAYGLLEWETTLQLIGIFGLALTIFKRVTSYNSSEDLKQDVRLILTPLSIGARAFSWAARKLEPNKVGLQTAPSTTSVHDRVLQAAAKLESQPSDVDEPSSQAGKNLA